MTPADSEPPRRARISASDLYTISACERRFYLWHHARDEAAAPDDYQRFLQERGREHERRVLAAMGEVAGPLWRYGEPIEPAAAKTARALAESRATLYQPIFLSRDRRRIGAPDFVYWDSNDWVIHDAKLLVDPRSHPELALQMAHYARLFEETVGRPPARCEITNGRNERLVVPLAPAHELDRALERAFALIDTEPEPDLLLSHSACSGCAFHDHCWIRAAAEHRIEILSEVSRRVAVALRAQGIHTIGDLAARTPEEIQGPGLRQAARAIVLEARAHRDGIAQWLGAPVLPLGRPLVWFDLEGDPDTLEADNPVYLWGLAIDDGRTEPEPETILADFGAAGDRIAWERFVARASEILERYPECVWVHYSPYERTAIKQYAARRSAPAGFVARMERQSFDLFTAVKRSVRLPIPSYSIKYVAPWVGFRWRNPDSGSQWSVIQFRRAREARNAEDRRAILDEIVRYNEDDLWAMRAVWDWLAREAESEAHR